MLTLTRRFKFEAAHHLPYYKGECHNLHGHTYHLDVTVTGNVVCDKTQSNCGMIIDFKCLKDIVQRVLKDYDHKNLNDFYDNPTAENLVRCLSNELRLNLPEEIKLVSVKLWEGDESYAEYTPN